MTKMAFIICYDNELYFKECIDYISWLKVPEGIETEIVGIIDAESIASGYNAAMRETKAKYKVYLHQDVFILYENFIEDVIDIFEQNPEYGMLGVMGSSKIILNADYSSQWNAGMAILDNSTHSKKVVKDNLQPLREAVAVDGMMLITQYDLDWRDDVFNGFDYYDISQCMEFRKARYKVGIPHQKKAWCNHVPIHIDLEKYDFYRKRFCEEYREYGYHFEPIAAIEDYNVKTKELQKIIPLIEDALKEKELDRAKALINTGMNFFPSHIQLCNLHDIEEIIQIERNSGIDNNFNSHIISVPDLLEMHAAYKFLLKRLEYGKPVGIWNDLLHLIAKNGTVGLDAEKLIAEHAVLKDDQTIWKLKKMLTRICSRNFQPQFDNKVFLLPEESTFNDIHNACSNMCRIIQELLDTEETAYCKKHQQTAELLLETIDYIVNISHVGHIDEDLYMAFLDTVEDPRNTALFAEKCQRWINRALHYIDRVNRQPLVSVLISVYNGGKFIEDTLRSVMNQSYQNLQIIVVDDCSSDNSREVVDRLAQIDKRIETLYLNENSNVCKAINISYKLAHGKYIALIGHDDIWKTDKIEKQVSFMEMYPEYAACFTLVNIIDDEKRECNEKAANLYHIFNQKNKSRKEWVQKLLFVQNILCAPSALIRKKCIKREYIYHFGIVQLQDLSLWLELLIDYPIYVMQERLTLYRKFFNTATNLSTINHFTENRLKHENKYLIWNYIKMLPDETFRFFFKEFFRNESAAGINELKCERAFILQHHEDLHCIDMFFELFEDDETRNILENKYNFKLNDFYALNSKTFSYDDEISKLLLEAYDMIHQCETIIEEQKMVIQKQQQLLAEKE